MSRSDARLALSLTICRYFKGWTLDYVDGLGLKQRARILGYITGMNRIEKKRQEEAERQAEAERRAQMLRKHGRRH